MKKDPFYLILGIGYILVSILLFFKNYLIFAVIVFILGVLNILKNYFGLFRFSLIDYVKNHRSERLWHN